MHLSRPGPATESEGKPEQMFTIFFSRGSLETLDFPVPDSMISKPLSPRMITQTRCSTQGEVKAKQIEFKLAL